MTKPDDEMLSEASEREGDIDQKSADKNSRTFDGRKASSSSSDDVRPCFNLEDETGF